MIRKFFRSFFFAILAASVAAWAYLGLVSAGSREAVLVDDRFTGLDEDVLAPGETRFVPALAVPGRVRLHRVTVRPRVLAYRYRVGLSRSEILGLDDSFYVRIESRLEYELDPKVLGDLFKKLDKPDWRELDGFISRRVRVLWDAKFAELYQDDGDIPGMEAAWRTYFAEQARADLNRIFSVEGLLFRRVDAVEVYVPDRTAYQNVLDASGDLLEEKLARIRRIEDAEARQVAEMIRDRAYYSRLEKIGSLLRQFPELKDYLAIDRLSDKVEVMVVPYDRWFPGEAQRRGPALPPVRNNPGARRFLPAPLDRFGGGPGGQADGGADATRPAPVPRAPVPQPFGGFRDLTPP